MNFLPTSRSSIDPSRSSIDLLCVARFGLAVAIFLGASVLAPQPADAQTPSHQQFEESVRPLLEKYCAECHSGPDANADLDFLKIKYREEINAAYETWEATVDQLVHQTMPPEDHLQPSLAERTIIIQWYRRFVATIQPKPAEFKARRLSVNEYRNTLRSVLGFDLEVAIIEAEQTIAERSRVIKLLPTDPPGESGFTNDTHKNPLSIVLWDQYSYLVDAGLEELFSKSRQKELQAYTGEIQGDSLTLDQAEKLVHKFVKRAWRRPVPQKEISPIIERLDNLGGAKLENQLKLELTSVLMSPSFLYRGVRMPTKSKVRQTVDAYELAERLSYFLWADMPDEELLLKASDGSLLNNDVLNAQIDRMIASPKIYAMSEIFATQWLTLNEIEKTSNNPPQMVALKSQPIDFMNYLFTENRPLLELVDSKVAFISPFTARMYGSDSKQMKRHVKPRGIEVQIIPNQKIELKQTVERGGILTMPGVLAMNKGPVIRGTWVLERILGEHLPDPPANVGQVPSNRKGKNLTFRQRFEIHRSNKTCAVCHDKIDPLGFALEGFNRGGAYVLKNYRPTKKEKKKGIVGKPTGGIDTSGKLPSGEEFEGIVELKKILTTVQSKQVIRNIVKRTMSYALCRKLTIFDQPTVEEIVQKMDDTNGTWRELMIAIANSVQFRETIVN